MALTIRLAGLTAFSGAGGHGLHFGLAPHFFRYTSGHANLQSQLERSTIAYCYRGLNAIASAACSSRADGARADQAAFS